MASKNKIFSNNDRYVSKYYSRSAQNSKKRRAKIKELQGPRTGREAHDWFKSIMDNVAVSDRDEVRGFDYEDVFDAAEELVDEPQAGYWTADQIDKWITDHQEEIVIEPDDPF
jgi:hypothetical protein